MMSETNNAKRRKRYAEDEEFRERDKAKSRAWKAEHREYIRERERRGRAYAREAVGRPPRPPRDGSPWTRSDMEALRSMAGLTVPEAARRLGRSERAVESRAALLCMGVVGGRLAARRAMREWADDAPHDDGWGMSDAEATRELRRMAAARAFYG